MLLPNQQLGWLVYNDENDDGFVAPEKLAGCFFNQLKNFFQSTEKLAGCFFQSIVRQVKNNLEE